MKLVRIHNVKIRRKNYSAALFYHPLTPSLKKGGGTESHHTKFQKCKSIERLFTRGCLPPPSFKEGVDPS